MGSCRLELGAGGGLVGLAVALGCGGGSSLLLTDQDEMLELMQHNIRLNEVGSRALALVLNWYASHHLPSSYAFALSDRIHQGASRCQKTSFNSGPTWC